MGKKIITQINRERLFKRLSESRHGSTAAKNLFIILKNSWYNLIMKKPIYRKICERIKIYMAKIKIYSVQRKMR